MANWGNFYYATDSVDGLTVQSGADISVRSNFALDGKLDGTKDTKFRTVSDNWPVFGFASDLGNVGSSPVESLFTLGLMQKNAVQFLGANGINPLPSLWGDYFGDDELEAVSSMITSTTTDLTCLRWLSSTMTSVISKLKLQT